MPSIPPDLLEADAVPEDAVKRLKCAPVLARYMQGVSTIWREGHGTAGSMKAQDDVDLCYQSNIVPIGIKVRGDAVESQKAQKRCFKKARKTGRNETKDCRFHYEYKSPYKSKKRSDQTVPQFPSPIRGTVPKIDFDVHETTDGEAVSPPTFQMPLCSSRELMDTAVVPIVFSPPKDPRVHRRKVAPKKPVDDRFDILKNLSDSLKKEAKEFLMKEVKTNTTAPTTPLMDGLISDDVLAKADELRRADKVGSLVGLESRKRTREELDEENRKKPRSSMKSKASNTIDVNKLKKALESTIDSIIMDDFELVDEVGDESSVGLNSRPGPSTVAKQVFTASKPLTVNLPLRLIPLDCLSNAKGLHLRRGLPRATDEYFHKRRNEFADYLETPIILLEPPRKKGRNQDILELLGIKMYKAKLKQYLAQPKLSIFEQRSDNGRFNLSTPEIDGIAKGIIPQYGNIDVTKFRMPTKFPYDGLYWPIFQPIDALVIKRSEKDTSRMENADVQNQIVNQATNNYISKRILLCDTSPQAWNRHFQMALSDKKKRVTVGRFTNRVGYARYLMNCDHSQKEVDAARERHRRAQQEEQREIDNQKAQQQREVLKSCNLKEGDAIPVGLLKEYKAAAKSTRLNDHLRATCRDTFSEMDRSNRFQGNRRPNPLPSYWFVIPMQQYVPANDRRTFLCKYTNHYNYNIVKNHPDPCNIVALSKWIGAAMTASHCAQYTKNLLCITLEDQKLGEARNRDIDRTLARGSTVKLSDLKRLCVLRPWEKKYWTLIWDHLCAAFRMLPPVSILVPMLEVPIDNAFKRVAILQNRDVYYNKYTEIKQAYLDKVESIQRMNEQERRRKRDMERRERHSNRNDYRFEYRQEDWQNQHYNQNFDPGENYRRY